MVKRVGKRGDTLIEVMLAVGIFSMVAVAVVAVMAGGTSSAQTSLETTLAREEIDAQAEALRFIQAAYIADKNAGEEGEYSRLWKAITAKAHNYSNIKNELSKYSPTKCSDLYEGTNPEARDYGFALDTRALGTFVNADDVIASNDKLIQASTYPRLVFNGDSGQLAADSDGFNNSLQSAEGIYIIAVRDPESTIITGSDKIGGKESAYFDFYIRTCWYGTGDQTPSTISTVMRLYDPDAIKEIEIEPTNPDPDPPVPEDKIAGSEYRIEGAEVFAKINGRSYYKFNEDPAILVFACYTNSADSRSYVGPVLIGKNKDSVAYGTDYDDKIWYGPEDTVSGYYYSSDQYWMKVPNCNNKEEWKNYINSPSELDNERLYRDTSPNGKITVKKIAIEVLNR